MQLLDRLDTRSWLVAGVLVVGGLAAALWPRGASPDDYDTVDCFNLTPYFDRFDNVDILHRAMQRRDALPDQIVPQCSTTTLVTDERKFKLADTQIFACDGNGCQLAASLSANHRVQHCDDGLPQQFLLRSEFVVDRGAGQGGAGQWHQLWCDDVGTQINGTGGNDRRLFACVSTIAEPGSNLATPPGRLVHRSNHHVEAAQPLETLSR
jgi:hypothetical protein